MAKSIIPAIKKSLDFLDNTKIRLLIVVLLVIYSAFISIQYNYSTVFNKPLIRLFFLLIIVIVSMKDITIGLLLAIAMLISINYKPVGATYEAMTLNCTPVDSESGFKSGSNSHMDSESNEGFDPESNEGFDSEEVEGFNTPPSPLPANVPAKTTPSPVTQTPAPANNTVKSSQPANVTTNSTGTQLPTQTSTQKSTPTPSMPTAPTMTTNGNIVTPTQAPKVVMPSQTQPISGGNSTTASLTKKITEMFSTKKHKQMKSAKHLRKTTKEHFSINGFMTDEDELPAEYNSSTNCLQVLQGTSGNNLNLSSQCGAVATFQDELNAQGMIELPMGYHSMGNWGSF